MYNMDERLIAALRHNARASLSDLAADLGLSPEPRAEHAAYIDHWLRGLRNDTRYFFQATAHAQRAVDFLHDLQPDRDEAAA